MVPTIVILALCSSSLAYIYPPVGVSYNTTYDNSSTPISSLACGSELAAAGYTTIGSLPWFGDLAGYGSLTPALCGQCFSLEYESNFIEVQVIDSASTAESTFVLSEQAYKSLTYGYQTSGIVTAYLTGGPFTCPS